MENNKTNSSTKRVAIFNKVLSSNPFDMSSLKGFVLLNLTIATLVCFAFCPLCLFSWNGLVSMGADWLYAFLISMLMSGGIGYIMKISNHYLSWLESPVKRFFFDLVTVTLYAFVTSFLLGMLFSLFIWEYFTFDNIYWKPVMQSTILPTVLALVITLFLTSRSFLMEWKQAAIETERMKTQQMEGQYMSLKNQLNPHFLFNSLNVLSNLVYESADQSNAFIEKLSRIYRYVLDVQNEELVGLKQELEFAESYLDLLAIRFGEKFTYSINVSDIDEVGVPPLSLQLLIENALKHNVLSVSSPLSISVDQVGEVLVVRNKKQLREVAEISSGVGLNNIKERYAFLSNREVEIIENGDFEVRIPLLKMEANV